LLESDYVLGIVKNLCLIIFIPAMNFIFED